MISRCFLVSSCGTIARPKPLKEANKPKSLEAMRNWLGHDGCYDDYRPTLPHFDQAAIAHMQYGKLPSTRELHVGKMRKTDRKKIKDNYLDIKERWDSYLALTSRGVKKYTTTGEPQCKTPMPAVFSASD